MQGFLLLTATLTYTSAHNHFAIPAMTNNELLNKLSQILQLDSEQIVAIFAQAEVSVSADDASAYSKSHGDTEHKPVSDLILAQFLNGLINQLRGKKDGPQATAETELSNNAKCMKIKIAFNIQADKMVELFELGELPLSKHEISAFFRKPDTKHYRPCKDDTLRAFIKGLALSHSA